MPAHGVAIALAPEQAQPLRSQQQPRMFAINPVFFFDSLTE